MQQGKQAELQLAEFDAVPCTKVSEIHVLRVEATSSSLSVGALYRPSLGFSVASPAARRVLRTRILESCYRHPRELTLHSRLLSVS